jgi:hypothetical protein
MAISLTTRRPGGFAEHDIATFESLLPAFAALIELLNAYFDVMAEPIKAQGGEILKFLGDGRKLTGNSEAFLAGFCRRLLDHGLPLERVNLHLKQLHPQFSSRSLLWHAAGGGTVARDRAHGIENTDQFRRSGSGSPAPRSTTTIRSSRT